MIEPLDIRTMLRMGAMVCLILTAVMIYYSLARKTYPGFHHWTAGIISIGLGGVLNSLRGGLPNFMTIVAANILIVSMPLLIMSGLATFFNFTWQTRGTCLAILVLYAGTVIAHTYWFTSTLALVICLSLVMALFFGEALRLAVLNTKNIFCSQEWILIFFLSAATLASLLRVAVSVMDSGSFGFIHQAGILHGMVLLMIIQSIFGTACAFIIVNAHRIECDLLKANTQIEDIANRDGLTNLFNRRYFAHSLRQEFRRAQRSTRPLSLLMGDVDSFKRYNDTYGHQAGDNCLKAIAGAFQQAATRPSDVAARYGGEEFALLLPDTDAEGARHIADIIQAAVQTRAIPHRASQVAEYVTLSIGIATLYPGATASHEDLIRHADQALYACKKNGKNQIQSCTENLPEQYEELPA